MSSSALSAVTAVAAEVDGTATAAPPPPESPQRPCAAVAAAAIGCLGDGRGGPSIDGSVAAAASRTCVILSTRSMRREVASC
eukprot:jgi/Chrpa1/21681/Chrysochromulina_OHIO_Genome00011514-RA